MATPEQVAQQNVNARACEWHMKVFRNNSGALLDQDGRPVRFGLGNISKKFNKEFKSGDLVGVFPIVVTPDMVGHTLGIFVNLECKPLGFKVKAAYPVKSREYGQNNFNNLILQRGGIAGFASSAQDVDQLVTNFYARFQNG